MKPRAFLFENSGNMLGKKFVGYTERLASRFRKLGFKVSLHLVDCADYGVPQRRKRLLMVGTKGEFVPPKTEKWVTVRAGVTGGS